MLADLLSQCGYVVDHFLGSAGLRGVAIARDAKGRRLLVTVIPEHPEAPALIARDWGTALPIASARGVRHPSGDPCFLLAEELELGTSSLHPAWQPELGELVPRWSIALTEEVARLHENAVVLSELRPELVMASASRPFVHALAERAGALLLLRRQGGIDEGDAVFHGSYGPLTAPSLADDVFRLAAVLWRWKRGVVPFPTWEPAGVMALREGRPVTQPEDDLDALLIECFQRTSLERPGMKEVLETLRAHQARRSASSAGPARESDSRGPIPPSTGAEPVEPTDPHVRRAREHARRTTSFLGARRASGELALARLYLELSIQVDLDGVQADLHGLVHAVKPDGCGDAYRFSGEHALASSYERRIASARTAPAAIDVAELERSRAAMEDSPLSAHELPESEHERKELVGEVQRHVGERLARVERTGVLRSQIHVAHLVRWRFFSERGSEVERCDSGLVVSIDHRIPTRSPVTRLYGEELGPADLEDALVARRCFVRRPTESDLDELVGQSLVELRS